MNENGSDNEQVQEPEQSTINHKPEDQLKVVLTEYQELKKEIIQNKAHDFQIFSVFFSALGLFYSLIFTQGHYFLILGIPLLSYTVFLRVLSNRQTTRKISMYIENEIEAKKIPCLVGKPKSKDIFDLTPQLWMQYQHVWTEGYRPLGMHPFIKILYFWIAFIPAYVYNSLALVDSYLNTGFKEMCREFCMVAKDIELIKCSNFFYPILYLAVLIFNGILGFMMRKKFKIM